MLLLISMAQPCSGSSHSSLNRHNKSSITATFRLLVAYRKEFLRAPCLGLSFFYYTHYTAELFDVIYDCGLEGHSFTDDTQVYLSFPATDWCSVCSSTIWKMLRTKRILDGHQIEAECWQDASHLGWNSTAARQNTHHRTTTAVGQRSVCWNSIGPWRRGGHPIEYVCSRVCCQSFVFISVASTQGCQTFPLYGCCEDAGKCSQQSTRLLQQPTSRCNEASVRSECRRSIRHDVPVILPYHARPPWPALVTYPPAHHLQGGDTSLQMFARFRATVSRWWLRAGSLTVWSAAHAVCRHMQVVRSKYLDELRVTVFRFSWTQLVEQPSSWTAINWYFDHFSP